MEVVKVSMIGTAKGVVVVTTTTATYKLVCLLSGALNALDKKEQSKDITLKNEEAIVSWNERVIDIQIFLFSPVLRFRNHN